MMRIIRFIWRRERAALWRSLGLSIAVLLAGVGLLSLSGWFIVAAGAAGLAGAGRIFDVFRPSAGVRFLALGRTAARYGERMLSHDATLRALAVLRLQVLRHVMRAPFAQMMRLRGAEVLNRLTSDIDALDGLTIRILMPVLGGAVTLLVSFGMIWWLVDWRLALWIVGGLFGAAGVILAILARRVYGPAQHADDLNQELRSRTVDHLRGRDVLAFSGRLQASAQKIINISEDLRAQHRIIAEQEIRSGAALLIASGIVSAGAIVVGGALVLSGQISPGRAALAFFATLALLETVAPLRRGLAEIGRMRAASQRLAPYVAPLPAQSTRPPAQGPALVVQDLQIGTTRPLLSAPLSFDLAAGDMVALAGPSGVGKTTVLNAVAGLIDPMSGHIQRGGQVGYLTQRPALLRGTIREAVLFGHHADDAQLCQVLQAVDLWQIVMERGGLEATIGEAGAGLSGGQRKRLALARVLIRQPDLLLLDEVTEGLDRATADRVLTGIRDMLPHATILIAAHREIELAFCPRKIILS